MDTKEVIARFEAKRRALMEHPNIARELDGGATETGRPFLVMELVKGSRSRGTVSGPMGWWPSRVFLPNETIMNGLRFVIVRAQCSQSISRFLADRRGALRQADRPCLLTLLRLSWITMDGALDNSQGTGGYVAAVVSHRLAGRQATSAGASRNNGSACAARPCGPKPSSRGSTGHLRRAGFARWRWAQPDPRLYPSRTLSGPMKPFTSALAQAV
jgi:hypothetical protein